MVKRAILAQMFSAVRTSVVPALKNLFTKPGLSLAFTYKPVVLVDVVHTGLRLAKR